ncbi:transcriptional regulator [Mycobacterium tuberculosis]|nr:transcriptional regulator [Mycobacterium tuberculosis]
MMVTSRPGASSPGETMAMRWPRGVAALRDPNARANPAGAELATWSLVHGFSTLWLDDAVNADVKQTSCG